MKVVPEKNAVRILWGRERGTRAFGAQRLLQELVEDKTRWMKWEGKVGKTDIFDIGFVGVTVDGVLEWANDVELRHNYFV